MALDVSDETVQAAGHREVTLETVAPEVTGLQIVMVNIFGVGRKGGPWTLIDTGLPFSTGRIRRWAAEQFGEGVKPNGIVLTHGHFDHVGTVRELAEEWDIPVYAHRLEMPYLTGRSDYPPPDPTVGGGAMAVLSPLYPSSPIDLGRRVRELPLDGSVPGMPGWNWLHTPGHSPGHISLFRESDRTLIAGDAVVTTKQESFLAVLTQRLELHGPPMYFTPDWRSSKRSVEQLAELRPAVIGAGHGQPMHGQAAADGLRGLAMYFDEMAKPRQGRYVDQPAITDERGIVALPPPVPNPTGKLLLGAAFSVAAVGLVLAITRSRNRN